MDIFSILKPKTFTLFIAPPAAGKTRYLLQMFKQDHWKFIFISPLRALADEFFLEAQKVTSTLLFSCAQERKEIFKKWKELKEGVLILTPELWDEKFLLQQNILLILDEVHLYEMWGETFRPKMREVFFSCATSGLPLLGLTATLSLEIQNKWEEEFILTFDDFVILDFGNEKLKYLPCYEVCVPHWLGQSFLQRRLEQEIKHKKEEETFLIFCAYRSQVEFLKKKFVKEGLSVLSCMGGQTRIFRQDLFKNPRPDLILATTALSHGVNLPILSKIFIMYEVKNKDLWLQMVGRGGRKGEEYVLYHLDRPFLKNGREPLFKLLWKDLCFKFLGF